MEQLNILRNKLVTESQTQNIVETESEDIWCTGETVENFAFRFPLITQYLMSRFKHLCLIPTESALKKSAFGKYETNLVRKCGGMLTLLRGVPLFFTFDIDPFIAPIQICKVRGVNAIQHASFHRWT